MIMNRIVVSNALKRSRPNVLSSMVLSSSRATTQQSHVPSSTSSTSSTIHRTNTGTCCWISQRSFGSGDNGYYKLRRKEKKVDPYAVLGVSKDETYKSVRKSFIQIAMKHHPDTAEASTPEQEDENRETFMAARSAFEMLIECPTEGRAILRSESELSIEEDVDVWFKEETGYDMPFMDAQTMKEVAEMTEKVGGGLDRDGGMWTLARMVTENMKSGGDGTDILRLESGDVRDRRIDGILRRRRKR
jgi:hypothetical protein